MARTISIRLGIDGAVELKQQLEGAGVSGGAALDKLRSSLERLGATDTAGLQGALDRVTQAATRAQAAVGQAQANAFAGVQSPTDDANYRARAADIAAYGAEMDRLRAKYDPLFAASKRYSDQVEEIGLLERNGTLTKAQAQVALQNLTKSYSDNSDKLNGATGHMGGFSLATAGATRELVVLGHEVVTGNFSRIPGSLIVMAERAGGLHDIISGVGAAVTSTAGIFTILGTVAVAALAVAGVEAEHEANRMGNLRQQLRLTHDDYAALADVVDTSARRIAGTNDLTTTSAEKLTQTIASSRYLGDFRAQLDQLAVSAANYARVSGTDVAKAGELFRQAIDDPAAAAKKLADEGLTTMDAALLRVITRLSESGQNAQATALTFSAIQRASAGATQDLSPLGKALDDLKQHFYGARDGGKSLATTIGETVDSFVALQVRGLDRIIEGLEKFVAKTQAIKAANAGNSATLTGGGGVDDYGRSYPSTAAPAATGPTSYVSQVDPSIQALLKASAAQYQVDQELLARLQLAENAHPNADGTWPTSSGNARGPLQVVPSTFSALPGFAGQDVNNPASNIAGGTSLFATLLKKYGDPYLAVLAYHDGEGLIDHVVRGDTQKVGVYTGQALTGTFDRPYAPSDAAIQEARRVTQGYSGTGLVSASTQAGGAAAISGRRSDLDNTAGFVPSSSLPSSINRLLGTSGSDGTPEDTADQIATKLKAAQSALADLTAQGTTSGPVFDRVNNIIAKLGGEAYSAVTPLVAQTRAITDQLGPLQANAGAQRTVAEAINQLRIADEQRGRTITPEEADQKRTEVLKLLALQFNDVVAKTDLQTAANTRLAASVDASQPSLIAATNHEKALAQAREDFLPGPEQDAAVDRYTAALNRQSASAADLATAQKQFDQRDQLQTLQLEGDLLGKNADEQAKALALLKEKQDLIKRGADLQSAASQADLANVAAIADATAAYNQQKAALSELSGFVSNTFDTISNAITTAFAQGGLSAVKFGDIAKSVASAIEAEFVKLALLNPLKNALFGTNDTTLGSIGGLVGKLFGGNSAADDSVSTTGGSVAAGVTALGSLGVVGPGGGAVDAAGNVVGASDSTSTATTSGSGSVLSSLGTIGTLAKGLDWLTGGKLISTVKDGFTTITNAAGYTAGQSAGQYVSSLIGEAPTGSLVGGAAADAGAYAGEAGAELGASGAAGGATGALGGAATDGIQAGVGAIGSAVDTVAGALPYIGAAISVVTQLINGNFRGAAFVAVGAIAGSYFGPWGTAIGAAIGEAIDLFFPQHPKNPYQNTEVDLVNGQIVAGKSVSQLEDTSGAKGDIAAYNTQLQSFLGAVGLKVADQDGAIGQLGNNIKGLTQITSVSDVIKGLHFDNADPNDTSNFGIAKHSLISDTFPDIQSLVAQLTKVAAFSDAASALGIQLLSVGKDLTDIQIASVSGAGQGNDLRDALAHDLPGQNFADVDALDAEIQKVNQFVNGTIPGLIAGIQQPASDFLNSVAKISAQYQAGIDQANAYGLSLSTVGRIQQAQADAVQQLMETELNKVGGLRDQDVSLAARLQAANGNQTGADLTNFDLKAKDELQTFTATLDATFGNASSGAADYLAQINELERVQGAERVAIVKQYAEQAAAAQLATGSAYYSVVARQFTLNGNDRDAALTNQDIKAAQETASYSKTLTDFYGAQFASTAEYQADMTQLETVQQGERLAIAQKYGDLLSDAQVQAAQQAVQAAQQAAAAQEQAYKQAQSSVASLLDSYTSYAQKLEVGGNSPLSPNAQYDLASSQFNAVAGAAQAGDYASAGKLTTYADSLISASRAVNGSGVGYASDVSRVLDALQNTSVQTDALTASSMQAALRDQTTSLQATLNDNFASLQAEVAALRRELANQTRVMAA